MSRESDVWAGVCLILAITCVRMNPTASTLAVAAIVAWMMQIMQKETHTSLLARVNDDGTTAMLAANSSSAKPSEGSDAYLSVQWSDQIDREALPTFSSTRCVQKSQIPSQQSVRKLREALQKEYFQ